MMSRFTTKSDHATLVHLIQPQDAEKRLGLVVLCVPLCPLRLVVPIFVCSDLASRLVLLAAISLQEGLQSPESF